MSGMTVISPESTAPIKARPFQSIMEIGGAADILTILHTGIEELKKQPLVPEEWDERLWVMTLDWATVHRNGRIIFCFKSGSEIKVEH